MERTAKIAPKAAIGSIATVPTPAFNGAVGMAEEEVGEVVEEGDDGVVGEEVREVLDRELDELVEDGPHSPVTDGTASGPFPIAIRFVPQLAALAR